MAQRWSDFSAVRNAFSNRNYAIFTAGNSVSLIGLWVQRLAVGWLAWQLTGSGFWLGAIAFADLFPVVLVGPIAGALADRLDRVKVSIACQTGSALQATVLCVLTATDAITIELLFALTLFQGTVVGIHQPIRLSLVPSLVRREDMTAAVAISSIIFNLARFIGPAIAGLIITAYGVAPAFATNALSYVAMIVALLNLRLAPRPVTARQGRGLLGEIRDGLGYAVRHPAIGPILLVMLATSVFGRPVIELLPAFVDRAFQRGADGLAILTAATGLGAVVGGLWLAKRGSTEGLFAILLGCSLAFGGVAAAFALTDHFAFAVALMTVLGFAVAVCGIAAQTLMQVSVEDALRGRVLSLYGLAFRGGPAIGSLLIGALSEPFGLAPPTVVAGGVVVATTLLVAVRYRRVVDALK